MMEQSGRILPSADTKNMSKIVNQEDIKICIKEAIKEALEDYFKIASDKSRTFDLKDETVFYTEILENIKLEIKNSLEDSKNIRFLDLDYYKNEEIASIDENFLEYGVSLRFEILYQNKVFYIQQIILFDIDKSEKKATFCDYLAPYIKEKDSQELCIY